MSLTPQPSPHQRFERYLSLELANPWARWCLLEGACLGLLGLACLLSVAAAPAGELPPLALILMLAGAVTAMSALRAEQSPGFAWSLLLALTAFAAGLHLLLDPIEPGSGANGVFAAYFAVRGAVTILLSATHRRASVPKWEWLTVGGVASLIMALLLLAGLPGPFSWMLGVLLGVSLLFDASALLALSAQGRMLRADAGFTALPAAAEADHPAPLRARAAAPSRV